MFDETEARQGNLSGLTFFAYLKIKKRKDDMTSDEDAELCSSVEDACDDAYDPDPLTLILEIANLVFQPGALGALAGGLAGGVSAVTGIVMWKDAKEKHRSEIRRKLYEIDRALTDGFSAMMVLASLLDQFNYLDRNVRVGGAPISGYKNAQRLRKAHEDCRSAVRDARDAFSDLSAMLPSDAREQAEQTIGKLNALSQHIMCFGQPYSTFLVAAAQALTVVDNFICYVGIHCDFRREPRIFTQNLVQSFPCMQYPSELR